MPNIAWGDISPSKHFRGFFFSLLRMSSATQTSADPLSTPLLKLLNLFPTYRKLVLLSFIPDGQLHTAKKKADRPSSERYLTLVWEN